MSTRAPIRFATYPGDVTGIVGEIKTRIIFKPEAILPSIDTQTGHK